MTGSRGLLNHVATKSRLIIIVNQFRLFAKTMRILNTYKETALITDSQ